MSVVCRWIGIGFSFTLVNLVDSIGSSWGAYVLEATRSWAIKVWGVWVGSIDYSWIGISGSLSTVVSVSVSISVVWVAVTTIAVSAIVASVSKTVSMVAIVSIRGCIGFRFSTNCRDKGKSKNGKFQHVEYELF